MQVVLDQSAEVLRAERGVLIARTHHGFVCANAGVDVSNAGASDRAIVLPADPGRLGAGDPRAARRARPPLSSSPTASGAPGVTGSSTWRSGSPDCSRSTTGAGARTRKAPSCRRPGSRWPTPSPPPPDLARAKDSREPVVLIEGLERFVTEEDGPGARALLRALDEDLFR